MKTMLMIVYNNYDRDARVQRAVAALSQSYDIKVLSIGVNSNENGSNSIQLKLSNKSNITNYLQFIYKTIRYSKNKKFDIIYAHDFYGAFLLLYFLKKKNSKKYIYDAHELYIPNNNDQFTMRDRIFYFFEKLAIKKADLVICAQEKRADIMQKHFGLKTKPVVIRNISYFQNASNSIPINITQNCKLFFDINAISIVYAGVITETRRINDLVDAVDELGFKYKLLIIGDGDYYEYLNNKITKTGNKNILLIPGMPYKFLANILKKCDIGYLYYPNKGLNNIYCAPNKIFEYASIGLPMISFYNPTLSEVFNTYNIGLVGDDIKGSIEKISNDLLIYKNKLDIFVNSNKWSDEANKLLNSINSLFVN